jgi:general nucleoside transport system permease protein
MAARGEPVLDIATSRPFRGVRAMAAHSCAAILPIALALIVGGLLVLLSGADPLLAYRSLVLGALGDGNSLAEVFVKATPLLLAGLGIAFAWRGGLLNIGAEGQLHLGALAATWAGMGIAMPTSLHIPVVILSGFLGGALWGAIPGLLKERLGVSEIITTLMMNYIAVLLVGYLVQGPLKDPGSMLPQTTVMAPGAFLPVLWPPTRLHAGILIGALAALIVYVLLWTTPIGYEIRLIGKNREVARHAGIDVSRTTVMVMAISGGLAGLAGMGEIAGIQHRLREGFSPGYGFLAIAVAFVGHSHPVGVVTTAILFAMLLVGADHMQRAAEVPASLVHALTGFVLLFALARDHLAKMLTRFFEAWSRSVTRAPRQPGRSSCP